MTASSFSDPPDAGCATANELHRELLGFLEACHAPAVVEPGETIVLLRPGEFSLAPAVKAVLLEVWGDAKVLRRRILRVRRKSRGRLDLVVEHFARKTGTLTLLDADASSTPVVERETARARELAVLRSWCERLFPLWRVEQCSCGTDLENSLSPRFPRAFLRYGNTGMAVLSVPDVESAADALAFALLWFRHSQSRWSMFRTTALAIFVPEEAAVAMGLRLTKLRQDVAKFRLFAVPAEGFPQERAQDSWGNLDSALLALGAPVAADSRVGGLFAEVAANSDAEVVEDLHGGLHLEVRGLPIAVCQGEKVRVGLNLREVRGRVTAETLLRLATEVASVRHADSSNTRHELYRSHPERWLEAVVRREIDQLDPLLDATCVRRQVSGLLGEQRSRTDLLALDRNGRLAIIEIKASEDVGLPIQALDYYARVRLQLERGELQASGLFGGRKICPDAPRLLLVAPALEFHPSNETVIGFFQSSIWVRQIGVAIEWRKKLRAVFDHSHNPHARGAKSRWQVVSSIRSGRPSPP